MDLIFSQEDCQGVDVSNPWDTPPGTSRSLWEETPDGVNLMVESFKLREEDRLNRERLVVREAQLWASRGWASFEEAVALIKEALRTGHPVKNLRKLLEEKKITFERLRQLFEEARQAEFLGTEEIPNSGLYVEEADAVDNESTGKFPLPDDILSTLMEARRGIRQYKAAQEAAARAEAYLEGGHRDWAHHPLETRETDEEVLEWALTQGLNTETVDVVAERFFTRIEDENARVETAKRALAWALDLWNPVVELSGKLLKGLQAEAIIRRSLRFRSLEKAKAEAEKLFKWASNSEELALKAVAGVKSGKWTGTRNLVGEFKMVSERAEMAVEEANSRLISSLGGVNKRLRTARRAFVEKVLVVKNLREKMNKLEDEKKAALADWLDQEEREADKLAAEVDKLETKRAALICKRRFVKVFGELLRSRIIVTWAARKRILRSIYN